MTQQQLGGHPNGRRGANALHVLVHEGDFIGRQRSISRLELGDGRGAHQIGWVLNLLTALDGPTKDLHYDFATKHCGRRCPAPRWRQPALAGLRE
ncbi:hypothetical protein HED50_14195 [Ochrobactrum oryzae]|nr:hypothetical protein [Brucella oryzae]